MSSSHACDREGCGGSCSYDTDYGAFMWDSDIDGVAALRHCTCDGHGECPEPFCILPMHDVTAKWGEHVGQGGREWR